MLAHAGRAHLLAGDLPAARTQLEDALQIARARAWAGVTAAPPALLLAWRAGDPRAQVWYDEALATASDPECGHWRVTCASWPDQGPPGITQRRRHQNPAVVLNSHRTRES